MSLSVDGRGAVDAWLLDVWAPELGLSLDYPVVGGALRASISSSTMAPGSLPPIVRLAGEALPGLVDSDRALELADGAGARAFRERTGAALRSVELAGRRTDQLVWSLFYSRLGSTDHLTVELDARTGGVVGHDGPLR